MSNKNFKPKKDSLIAITEKYANNMAACTQFFFNIKWPTGFYCEKCGCHHYHYIEERKAYQCQECKKQHYLLAGTIFQDNKLPLYKLILGLYLFFSSNKGISAVEIRTQLNVNSKTAERLLKKCRMLMQNSNNNNVLDSLFYESDVAYIGAKSEKKGMATDKQPFLVILSTKEENRFPMFVKMCPIVKDAGQYIKEIMDTKMVLGKDRILNTDGKTTYNIMSDSIIWKGDKILYKEIDHKLFWLNIIWSNAKNQIIGIYHGVSKRSMPLFMQEQEWRFNHRNIGGKVLDKIQQYISMSTRMTEKMISQFLDKSLTAIS